MSCSFLCGAFGSVKFVLELAALSLEVADGSKQLLKVRLLMGWDGMGDGTLRVIGEIIGGAGFTRNN